MKSQIENIKKNYCEKPSDKKLLGFRDWPLILIGVPVLGFSMPILFMGLTFQEAFACFFHDGIWSVVFTGLFWMGNRQITIFFRRMFPSHADLTKRLLKQLVVTIIFTFSMSFIIGAIESYTGAFTENEVVGKGLFQTFLISFSATIFVVTLYEAVYFFTRWKESIAETEKLKKERLSSQLEALKNQVNPHFLFNSLNTLASIIPEDQKKAVEFVQRMSTVYRNILDLNQRQVVTLREELESLKDYLFLVQTRFPENLKVVYEIRDKDLEKFLVPMSLQILVENAIKHNVISMKKPLAILIKSDDTEFLVENEFQPKPQEQNGTKTGLKNIDNRNKLIFDRNIIVDVTEQTFGVRVPLEKIEEK